MIRVGFHTFGCKLNQFETEALAFTFRTEGFALVTAREDAEIYLINTCTVTARADHKARALVRALARSHPDSTLLVTGCAASLEAEVLSRLADNVIVVPQAGKAALLDLPRLLAQGRDVKEAMRALDTGAGSSQDDPFAFQPRELSYHTRAFFKIQDGCDSRCAYCRVPLARGPSVSLNVEETLRRARQLEESGYRELVITGVNISAWRRDGLRLPGLLSALIAGTRRIRLRLSSLEPEAITEELAGVFAEPRVCPHFHIPVQSGSDAVLARMNRRYRVEKVMEGVEILRRSGRDPFLAADILVGFPGETEEDFKLTRGLVESARFAALHVFPFSPRPGTPASSLTPRVPERIARMRARELTALARSLSREYARSWVGKDVEVLLEEGGAWNSGGSREVIQGVSGNYLKVVVRGAPRGEPAAGRIALARIVSVIGRCEADFLHFDD